MTLSGSSRIRDGKVCTTMIPAAAYRLFRWSVFLNASRPKWNAYESTSQAMASSSHQESGLPT